MTSAVPGASGSAGRAEPVRRRSARSARGGRASRRSGRASARRRGRARTETAASASALRAACERLQRARSPRRVTNPSGTDATLSAHAVRGAFSRRAIAHGRVELALRARRDRDDASRAPTASADATTPSSTRWGHAAAAPCLCRSPARPRRRSRRRRAPAACRDAANFVAVGNAAPPRPRRPLAASIGQIATAARGGSGPNRARCSSSEPVAVGARNRRAAEATRPATPARESRRRAHSLSPPGPSRPATGPLTRDRRGRCEASKLSRSRSLAWSTDVGDDPRCRPARPPSRCRASRVVAGTNETPLAVIETPSSDRDAHAGRCAPRHPGHRASRTRRSYGDGPRARRSRSPSGDRRDERVGGDVTCTESARRLGHVRRRPRIVAGVPARAPSPCCAGPFVVPAERSPIGVTSAAAAAAARTTRRSPVRERRHAREDRERHERETREARAREPAEPGVAAGAERSARARSARTA